MKIQNTPASLALSALLTAGSAHAALLSAADSPNGGPIAIQSAAESEADSEAADVHATLQSSLAEVQKALAQAAHDTRSALADAARTAHSALAMADVDIDDPPEPPEPPEVDGDGPVPPNAPEPPMGAYVGFGSRTAGTDAVRILRTSEADPKTTAQVREDLAVMVRLLDKAASGKSSASHEARVMGLDLMFLGGGAPARAVYLEDYGAIFAVPVNVALMPPAEKSASASPPKTEEDSEWEQARREVVGGGRKGGSGFRVLESLNLADRDGRVAPYSESKVTELQTAVLQALKNAGRIRDLKPTDRVLVCLNGPGPAGPKDSNARRVRAEKRVEIHIGDAAPNVPSTRVINRDEPEGIKGSTMNIQVTKADAEAFASGGINLQEFRSRVKIAVYPGTSRRGDLGF